MKTVKSYSKTPLLLSRICAVSFAIFVLASCGSDSDKPLVEAPRDPAGTYREYLSDIRRQANPSFTVLTKHIRRWQTVKDSVFTCIKRTRSVRTTPLSVKSASGCMIPSVSSSRA